MWRADSLRRDRQLLYGWVGFAVVGVAAMLVLPGAETIPFHLVWVSFGVVYGLRSWSLLETTLALTFVTVSTGIVLVRSANRAVIEWEETSEIPLMALLIAVMVWHVRHRTAATERLARMAERQRRFVRRGSHELRTPLTVARGHAEQATSSGTLDDARACSVVVVEELDRLDAVADRLLALGAVDGKGAGTPPTPVQVADLLTRLAQRWRPVARRSWSVDAQPLWVEVDPARLETALDCLVENAVRYSAAETAITLAARARDGAVEITVRDAGRPARAPRPRGGTGLGLPIARGVVQDFGGRLVVESVAGQGTTAVIRLPRRRPSLEHESAGSLPRHGTAMAAEVRS